MHNVARNDTYRALEDREVRRDDLIVTPRETRVLPRDRTGRALVNFLNERTRMEIWRVSDRESTNWTMERIGIIDQNTETGFRAGGYVVRQFRPSGEVISLQQGMGARVLRAA